MRKFQYNDFAIGTQEGGLTDFFDGRGVNGVKVRRCV
jgi:hypothetical protein